MAVTKNIECIRGSLSVVVVASSPIKTTIKDEDDEVARVEDAVIIVVKIILI